MSQELSKADSSEPVTADSPKKRRALQRRGFKLSTPVGEIAFAIRTPKYQAPVPKWFDPFGIAGRATDAAKVGMQLASWGEEQLMTLLRDRLDAVETTPKTLQSAEPDEPTSESLHTKMGRLLERALDQSTSGSQVELYHRLLNQLVADEARIIGALSDGASSPLVNVRSWTRSRTPGQAVLENACLIGRTANVALPGMVPQYVGHLLSLGLVETGPEDPGMKSDYEVLMAEPAVLAAIKTATRGPLTARVERLTLSLSSLGMGLWEAAMQQDGR
ncbi:Abi-alpha family protein [Mycobacterium sp. 852013-50091_SCH5140682]|uniref:Abi-alpha family protein n=1 Tax=Mycobacterium sp. 852013-50091_SCH5140682 TaxID=1834109 RepID=UPI000B018925|nr:Abi-alpha family protein [Mycobacterium sp. 852013-50091_SCH5140682]